MKERVEGGSIQRLKGEEMSKGGFIAGEAGGRKLMGAITCILPPHTHTQTDV